MTEYKIVVREMASKEAVYRETYKGTQQDVERRAGQIWNNPYASMPDRYRLYVYEKGHSSHFMTIG